MTLHDAQNSLVSSCRLKYVPNGRLWTTKKGDSGVFVVDVVVTLRASRSSTNQRPSNCSKIEKDPQPNF